MRNPEIKITQRNVTGMRYASPRSVWAAESAKLIMIVALVGIVSFVLLAREGM